MIPRFMYVYSLPVKGRYITKHKRRNHLSVEIVEISEQDNIETLLRYFQYAAKVKH